LSASPIMVGTPTARIPAIAPMIVCDILYLSLFCLI
jgi:hypothetical protein